MKRVISVSYTHLGTCNETHYVRADSLEQVVLLELNRMVSYLQENEEEFAELRCV